MKKRYLLLILTLLSISSCGKNSTNNEQNNEPAPINDRYNEGVTDGYNQGKTDGYNQGKTDGYKDGKVDGYKEGQVDGYNEGKIDGNKEGKATGYEEGMLQNEPVYSIHTELQDQYLKGPVNLLPISVDGLSEKSIPNPITINVASKSSANISNITKYVLILATNKDFSDAVEISATGSSSIFTLYNLNIGTRYFYKHKIQINNSSYQEINDVKTFYVDGQAPRNIYVDGVTNFRDLGGWQIEGTDKRTNQNLLYRCGQLHVDLKTYVTSKGIEEINNLGIKSEIDFRDMDVDGINKLSSQIPGVEYYYCPVTGTPYYDEKLKDSWKKAFKVVSDRNNLPVMYHCAIGTDRTGFFSYVINALCGVSLDDIKRDYMFSAFGNINGTRSVNVIDEHAENLNTKFNGQGNRSKAAYNFLKYVGLTDGEINNIKEIFTGEKCTHEHIDNGSWIPSEINNNNHVKICQDENCDVVLHSEPHSFGELIVEVPPTAIADGYGYCVCSVCNYVKEEIIKHESKDFDVLNMKDYGSGKSFSVYVDCDNVTSINLSDSNFIVLLNGVRTDASVTFTPKGEGVHPLINITLVNQPNSGDVITLAKDSVLAGDSDNYVLGRDVGFTFDGTLYAPSFYRGSISTRNGSSGVQLELSADFSDFFGGQAADGLQPYYTSTDKGKVSHFIYTLTHGGQTYTVTNDNHDLTNTLKTTTMMYWDAAQILRITIPKDYLSNGDIFTIKKGSIYADNAGHAGNSKEYKRYILDKDVACSYNADKGKFELL